MTKHNIPKENLDRIRKKKKMVLWAAGGFVVFYFLFSFLFGDLGFLKYIKMKNTHSQLQKEIIELQNENKRLRKEAEALKSDPEHIEKMARERLNLIKEGETVYQYNEK